LKLMTPLPSWSTSFIISLVTASVKTPYRYSGYCRLEKDTEIMKRAVYR
jgi:hypothetical protein